MGQNSRFFSHNWHLLRLTYNIQHFYIPKSHFWSHRCFDLKGRLRKRFSSLQPRTISMTTSFGPDVHKRKTWPLPSDNLLSTIRTPSFKGCGFPSKLGYKKRGNICFAIQTGHSSCPQTESTIGAKLTVSYILISISQWWWWCWWIKNGYIDQVVPGGYI